MNPNTQEPNKNNLSKMKYELCITKGVSQNPTDTPLVTQFHSTQKCVTKGVSTVFRHSSAAFSNFGENRTS